MEKVKDKVDKAYDEGYQVGYWDPYILANPHQKNTEESEYWTSGWEDGVHDSKLKNKNN